MISRIVRYKVCVAALLFALALPFNGHAKGYSSGGHSYSSHSSSSSHSFGSGGGRSSSSGSTRSSSSGGSSSNRSSSTKTFNSGGGKSYTSGSSSSGTSKGYSSSKSYSSGSGINFSSGSTKSSGSSKSVSKPGSSSGSPPSSGSSGFNFDSAAARANKEQASKSDFSRFKESQKPPVIPRSSSDNSYGGRPPPIPGSTRSYTRTVYVPDYTVIRTRPSRINVYFGSYGYRPWVYYHDPYSSLFWWWLLDRSLDEQAYWAYHHRYDMDPARYDTLMASNQQLQNRVTQLEAQQVARDPSYTPPSLDSTNRDLMYSDQYVNQSYQTRSTPAGRVAFWVFAVPLGAGVCAFFIWLIWFKRWQPATA